MAHTTTHTATQPRHIMRLPHVKAATGYGRAWIYQLMSEGRFPQARRIGTRAVGWDSLEIDAWVAEQLGGQK
ncbi:AlpA family transcriptional regulator [Pseudomonas sp. 2FE]|uniref:helix-turn-helix transcriptional regulator n=1 Tax=Pseudomonas sp. 2FE TaxID=2502190 RepID=UPI0010F9C13C|nr:AlpA family phage regulatory protein [Pseudomonas sp. 2FE]